ncbi:ABC transporter substrate-binding protein [Elusimicrobiota bacterium]
MVPHRPRLLTALVAVALLTACSGKDGKNTSVRSKDKGTYIHAAISDIDSIDPSWAYDSASHNITSNIYEPLVDYRGSSISELEPRIAETVPTRDNGLISPDGRTYTFPIRKGVKFHEGGELTPEDVRYSLMRFMLLDRSGGPSSLLLEPVTGIASTRDKQGNVIEGLFDKVAQAIRVEGDHVVLTLHKPFSPILTVLAAWAYVVPKDWCVEHGAWDGTKDTWKRHNNPEKTASYLHDKSNGTGPFTLERWDKQNKEVLLKRFDGYWKGKAKLKRAIIRGVNEFQTRKLMLAAGDADSIYSDYMQQPLLQNIEGVEILDDLPRIDVNPAVFFVLKINTGGNPYVGSGKLDGKGIPANFFADLNLRKAFAHSLDYEGFIRDVNRNKGSRANSFIPKALFGHNPDQPWYDYDLEKAEAYFKKAHGGRVWKNGFKFTFAYNGHMYGELGCTGLYT